jgi:hypothetical protein
MVYDRSIGAIDGIARKTPREFGVAEVKNADDRDQQRDADQGINDRDADADRDADLVLHR